VCLKPYFVKRAVELLQGSDVLIGCVIGFPHGNSLTEVKRYETELACRDGAVEIDMVVNLGKALGGDWEFVERDVKAVCDEAHRHGARVKVIFENDYLTKGGAGLSADDFKRKLCEVCERAGADWVKTSTGYGFVKQPDGSYNYKGATEHDLALMRASCSPRVQVKAAGGVRDLDGLIKVRDLGVTRCGATATAAMLDEYRRREAAEKAGKGPQDGKGAIGAGGY
jgi:deoxyribose-phosphate aldolase